MNRPLSTPLGGEEPHFDIVGWYMLLVLFLSYGLTSQIPAGIPVHYLALFVCLAWACLFCRSVPNALVLPMLLLSYALLRGAFDSISFRTIRNMGTLIDVLWIVPGVFWWRNSRRASELRRGDYSLLGTFLLSVCMYGIICQLGPELRAIPPRFGMHRNGLFGYGLTSFFLAPALFLFSLTDKNLKAKYRMVLMILSLALVFISMSRIGLVSFMLAVFLLFTQKRVCLRQMMYGFVGIAIVLGIGMALGVKTRYGVLGFDLLYNAVLSMVGQGNNEGAANGLSQRLHWWRLIFERVKNYNFGWLVGMGFNQVLTDHVTAVLGKSVATVEPHNSWVSIYAKTGIIGLLGLMALFLRTLQWLWRVRHTSVFWPLLVVFFSMFLNTMFEPGFENPNLAAPFWFMAGCLYAESHSRQKEHSHLYPCTATVKPNFE